LILIYDQDCEDDTMPAVKRPFPDCAYTTDDLDPAIVAALITAHSAVHTLAPAKTARVEKVKRPTVTSAGSSDWAYFLSRWNDYVAATNWMVETK